MEIAGETLFQNREDVWQPTIEQVVVDLELIVEDLFVGLGGSVGREHEFGCKDVEVVRPHEAEKREETLEGFVAASIWFSAEVLLKEMKKGANNLMLVRGLGFEEFCLSDDAPKLFVFVYQPPVLFLEHPDLAVEVGNGLLKLLDQLGSRSSAGRSWSEGH